MSDGSPTPRSGRARVAEARTKVVAAVERANTWVEETAERRVVRDVALALRDRDRDAFASVLGSAIAMRLFLFTTALIVVIVSVLNLFLPGSGVHDLLSSSSVTGKLARDVENASQGSSGRHIVLLLGSLFLAASAGRSLTKVLAACSAGAWRVEARTVKASLRVVWRITAFISLLIIAAAGLNRLRDRFGIAVATTSLVTNALVMGAGWFFLTLSLPKQTRDPGAMLPGAALFGIIVTGIQWFMQFYLPRKIASASEVMGAIGFTVATLGYLFLIGRVMAGCIVVNAVLWERFGSISEFVFGLPGIRRLPARSPRIRVFFDLPEPEQPVDEPVDGS